MGIKKILWTAGIALAVVAIVANFPAIGNALTFRRTGGTAAG